MEDFWVSKTNSSRTKKTEGVEEGCGAANFPKQIRKRGGFPFLLLLLLSLLLSVGDTRGKWVMALGKAPGKSPRLREKAACTLGNFLEMQWKCQRKSTRCRVRVHSRRSRLSERVRVTSVSQSSEKPRVSSASFPLVAIIHIMAN